MNIADWIIIIIICVMVCGALCHMVRSRKRGGCGCGCSRCTDSCQFANNKE